MTRLRDCTAKALAAVTLLGLASCQSNQAQDLSNDDKLARIEEIVAGYREKFSDVPGIEAEALRAELARGAVVLVDVRTAEERSTSMIEGAIGSDEFERRAAEFEGASVVTYCTVGYRSGGYARKLREDGWEARNFDGSVLAWTHAGGALVDAEGRPTRRVHVYGERWNLAAEGYEPVW